MNVQVLVATMNQVDHSLLRKMNIQSDVIVGNQCKFNKIEEFEYCNYRAIYLNFCEKGVGLNRNNALMRATGDICLFADDDMEYVDDYAYFVKEAFENNPNADVIIFNISGREINERKVRVNRFNYLRYGSARIGIRRESVIKRGIFFNQCFGGGTMYCHGEDSLFLTECLKKGLRIVAVPTLIAHLTDERESTWNSCDIEKYLNDQGVLYKTISRHLWKILCLQDSIRHCDTYSRSWSYCYQRMKEGK